MKLDKTSRAVFLQKLKDFLLETENIRSGGFGSTGKTFYNKLNDYIETTPTKIFKDEMLKYIDKYKKETRKTEVDLYKKAQVDRRNYSRFLKEGTLTKGDIICYCIALKLDMKKTNELLQLAGYALGHTIFDRIIIFCIENKYYDVDDVNDALCHFDQKLIGIQRNVDKY